MTAKLIDMKDVRRTWERRYGVAAARKMLAGAPGMAYDAMPPRDQQPENDDDRLAQVKTFLRNRLSPEDFQRLEAMLSGGDEPGR
jgi:hypothetical protein